MTRSGWVSLPIFPAVLGRCVAVLGGCAAALARSAGARGACTAFSRVMSRAGLSARRPWKTECRIWPPLVQPENDTSATSRGFTQWTPRPCPPATGVSAVSMRASFC
ncbi:hypothetical protein D3C87_1769080 [compost metagenome]